MNETSRIDLKRWAILVKTNEDVKALRKIVCHKCRLFKQTADDNSYARGGCQYYIKTGDARVWSIMDCIDRGCFIPKMNVDVEIVRGKLNGWIERKATAALGFLPVCYLSRADGGVCGAKLPDDASDQREDGGNEERMLEV